jgi:hypothetical protein
MQIVEVYFHLKPHEVSRDAKERLGATLNEVAYVATQRFFGGGCYVEVRIEEGSTKGWIVLTGHILLTVYGGIADLQSFKSQIWAWKGDAEMFAETVVQHLKYGEDPRVRIARTERRFKTTGKLDKVATLAMELKDNGHRMTRQEYCDALDALKSTLAAIQRDVDDNEMRRLLEIVSFETLHERGPLREEPLDLFVPGSGLRRPKTGEEELDLLLGVVEDDKTEAVAPAPQPNPNLVYRAVTYVPKRDERGLDLDEGVIEIKQPRVPPRQLDL